MPKIHPTAIVHDGARLGADVEIGPYSLVGAGVTLGDGVRLLSHAVIDGQTEIGDSCVVHPFAYIGGPPQHLAHKGEPTRLVVGARNTIREHVTMHTGTVGGGRVEAAALRQAAEMLRSGDARPRFASWSLKGDVGMTCGGSVKLYFEPHPANGPWTIAVFGAGHVAAKKYKAAKIVDPRPYAIGTIKKVYENFLQITDILPAMGYGDAQMAELKKTINAIPADIVIVGTPIDLAKHLNFNKPSVRVTYQLKERKPALKAIVQKLLKK